MNRLLIFAIPMVLAAALPLGVLARDYWRQAFMQSTVCGPAPNGMYVYHTADGDGIGTCHYIHRSVVERIGYWSFS
jgi:hypothetical protein